MIHRISRISPHQAGKLSGAMYFILGMLVIPFFLNGLPSIGESGGVTGGRWLIVLLPFFYGVVAYIFAIVSAMLYNWLARYLGGLEITLDASPTSQGQQ